MSNMLYSTPAWDAVRSAALRRDGHRCSVARLLGGRCTLTLHVHHLQPIEDGGPMLDLDNLITVCARHHPKVEAVRRAILARREPRARSCRHRHVTPEARALCEAKLNAAA